jgi:hypothetical protein
MIQEKHWKQKVWKHPTSSERDYQKMLQQYP